MKTPQIRIIYKPYAMNDNLSRGRDIEDIFPIGDLRSQFQHDRDRIIHSKAFRRLESKTQVVHSHDSDHNRTRLTHSIEVMQISDSIAYSIGVNIYLTQAIALGHDLGHAPFGHRGEGSLNEILKDHGLPGFKHNYQSLLIVNKLEKSYRNNNGLNLMLETRDGILRHTIIDDDIPINDYDKKLDTHRKNAITLEGQIVNVSDEIAQRTHDTDDGLRAKRISLNELLDEPIIKKALKFNHLKKTSINSDFDKDEGKTTSKIIGAMIKFYISDIVSNTFENIKKHKIKKYEDVLKKDIPIVSLSPKLAEEDEIFKKSFLRKKYYDHHEIKRMDSRGNYFINQLFKAFKSTPGQLPKKIFDDFAVAVKSDLSRYRSKNNSINCMKSGCIYEDLKKQSIVMTGQRMKCPLQEDSKPACNGIRVLINYIAGMTDRHANMEYTRLYLPPGRV